MTRDPSDLNRNSNLGFENKKLYPIFLGPSFFSRKFLYTKAPPYESTDAKKIFFSFKKQNLRNKALTISSCSLGNSTAAHHQSTQTKRKPETTQSEQYQTHSAAAEHSVDHLTYWFEHTTLVKHVRSGSNSE